MGLDVTEFRALRDDLLREFQLDASAALVLLDGDGEVLISLDQTSSGWYVEQDLEGEALTVRLVETDDITFADITATVDVAYRANADTGYTLYGPMVRGQWDQGSAREWRRVGSAKCPWTPPAGSDFNILLESGDALLLETGDGLLLEAAP